MEKIREDLGEIVKNITFKLIKGRYSDRKVIAVELKPFGSMKQGNVINFSGTDVDGLFDLDSTARKLGRKVVKSMALVEELKKDVEEGKNPVYVGILVVLEDGSEFRFFPNRTDKMIIDLFYDEYIKAKSKKANA